MGRNRKNKFEKTSLRFETERTDFELHHVKVPFFVNVTYKEPISPDKKYYGTATEIVTKDISKKDEIIKDFQKDGSKEVLNVEEFTIRFSDDCPKCNRKGIPKVELKSNKFDYHARAISPLTELPKHKNLVNRPDEYWLCYDHETKPKKCRVAKWDKNHFTFTKNGKIYTKLRKYILPYYLEWKQGELNAWDSFQKFLNIFHV